MDVPGAVGNTALERSTITVTAAGGALDAFLARPRAREHSRGGVIVIHEAFGLNDHIRDVASRFAVAGYDAIAPDLYTSCGAPAPDDMADLFGKMLGLSDTDVVAGLEAAAAALRALDTSNGAVGVIGFCSGGRQTLLFACSSAGPTAAVDCWGGFIDRASPDALTTDQRPRPVIELLDGLGCPLLAVGGGDDQNPAPAVLGELERRLDELGKDAEVKIFAGAGHAFFADYRSSYAPAQAHELWQDVTAFFRIHLSGAG